MNYVIITKAISNEKALKTLARKLSSDNPDYDFAMAQEYLKYGGVPFAKGLSTHEVKKICQWLKELNVGFSIATDDGLSDSKYNGKDTEPQNDIQEKSVPVEKPKIIKKTTPKKVEKPKEIIEKKVIKREHKIISILVIIIAIVTIVFVLGKIETQQKNSSSTTTKQKAVTQKTKSKIVNNNQTTSSYNENQQTNKTEAEIDNIMSEADALCGESGSGGARLYRIAISFNKYNINAWYGLLNCYRSSGMTKEANDVQKEIDKLFGKEIFSVRSIIKPYGKIKTVKTDNGECRIFYNSKNSNIEDIKYDAFRISKGLVSTNRFNRAVIFAVTNNGKKVLIIVELNTVTASFSQFKRDIQFNIVN